MAEAPRISLVVAMSSNRVIGRDGRIPWHLPAELKRFKQLTMGHPIVMGRKTWDSIRRLLPGRTTIVVTRDPKLAIEGARVARSLDEALRLGAASDEIFVIGGAEIFRLALPLADRIYLTTVQAEVEGDTFMPEFELAAWRLREREHHPVAEGNPLPWLFEVYERVCPERARA